MLLYVLTWLLHSILATPEDNNLTLVGFVTTQAICPLDPFVNLQIHATPKQSDPICCLIPPSSEESTSTEEFLSFEEWKSRQRDAEDRSTHAQTANQTSHPDSSSAKSPDNDSTTTISTPQLSDTESILDFTPTQLPHFRVPLTDRFNYASSECSARIRSSHPSSRSPSSLLSSKKDKYMLSPCSVQPNHVVVELCDDIRIDTVQLANFEYFSGVFRDFRVSVAQTYTNDDQAWVEAGTYRAKNIRGVQSFHPLVDLRPFYRYVRIDFLSYYGSEYYCPISLLRVYGLTQLEEWKWELWQSNSEPTLPQGNGLFTTVAEQIMELQNVSISDTPAPSTSDPSQDHSAGSKEILVPVTSTDLKAINKDDEVLPTSATASLPVSSTTSVIPSADSISNPINSPNFSTPGPHSPHSTIPSVNTSLSSTISSGSSMPVSGSGDSIFRTIMNRLSMLEANTTLYHKYVEEQTLRLRDALRKLEEDVGRLEGLNKNQQQIFFKTVQELDRHRRQMEAERTALLDRVSQLADEIILEKRLGIAQLCLLLTVLIFMTLTRGSRTNVPALFGGATHHHPRLSSVDLSDSFTRPRSKTPVPNGAGKKGRVRSHSITNPPTPKATPRTPPRRDSYTILAQRSDVNNATNKERPTYRLYRSNSNTTSVTTPSSAKRLAQTAHLHDLSVVKRRKPSIPEDRTSSDFNVLPLQLKKTSGGIDGIYTADTTADKSNESWIDTEPGSGASDNDQESSPEPTISRRIVSLSKIKNVPYSTAFLDQDIPPGTNYDCY